jgi:hypothetical protein
MLVAKNLEDQIKSALKNIIPPAIEQCILASLPEESKLGNEKAKEFADTFDKLVSADLASLLASAIDYYVHNISIYGTIITVGSMVTQTAPIIPSPPTTAGKVPNTLGIQ